MSNPWPFALQSAGPAARRWRWELRGGRGLELGGRTVIMGIVNVTPDSFSDGGRHFDRRAAVEHGLRLAEEGAGIVDVGGQSTRPGSAEVPLDEELDRVLPVIEGIRAASPVAVSVDTYRADVARRALAAGADIVNDISAFRFDAGMLALLAETGAPAVAMHIRGTPRDMQRDPRYADVVGEVAGHLREAVERAERAGVRRERLAVDPGIGFGKTLEHNLELLRNLPAIRELGCPVAVGASRKAFIGSVLGQSEPAARLEGTLAVTALAAAAGADIVRVHDACANLRAARMAEAVVGR
ncbi:MAG TPA: dihydropteroate synthase [Planctomycetota bacterium]|nr:dihydropteroate synthase [Planctomycetota bacterium]